MDIGTMLGMLDEMYADGRLKEAEEKLNAWLLTALEQRNLAAALTIYNEMEGLYRTTGRAHKAAEISDTALGLIKIMGLCGTVHHATTLQNGATANRVANNNEKALKMYLEACEIYNQNDCKNSYQMASLHNNISHIYQELGQHSKALEHLQAAAKLIETQPDSAAEIATTNVCTALSYMALEQLDTAQEFLDRAMIYYNSEQGTNDGHRGSALCALGELLWHKKQYEQSIGIFEEALDFTLNRFGENDGCKIIRNNIETVRKEMNGTFDR